jgi:glycosyltransferase involved in cell wall biosynthesis
LNTLEPTLVANVAFPNKVLQYLAAGLPVVSTKLQGLMTVFDSEKSILWRESASDAVKAACRISKNELLEMSSGTGTKLSLSKFSPAVAVEKFESELELLTKVSD